MAGYDEDLAFVHATGYGELAEAAGRELLDLVEPPGVFVDLGCGGGTLSAIMARAGFDVRGFDLSPHMIGLARANVPKARFEVADVHGLAIPRCMVVAAVGEVFNYAFIDNDVTRLRATFARIFEALTPGGIFLFDVAAPGRSSGSEPHEKRGRGWRVRASATEDGEHLTRTIETWRIVQGEERQSKEIHKLRVLPRTTVFSTLEQAGFHVDELGAYDDMAFADGWDAYLARKPS